MARIRSVKPELCTSETMAAVSAEAERTFVRLWTHCDDEGRCKDHPRLLKAQLYPLHDDVSAADVDRVLTELESHGLIVRYSVDGERFLSVPSWHEHQKPQKRQASKLPGPEQANDLPKQDHSHTTTRPLPEGDGPVGEGRVDVVVGVAVDGPPESQDYSQPTTPAEPTAADQQKQLKTAALVSRTIEPPAGAIPDAYAAGIAREINTGPDPTRRDEIARRLAAGDTPEQIAATWTETNERPTVSPEATQEAAERARNLERATADRLARQRAEKPVADPHQAITEARTRIGATP